MNIPKFFISSTIYDFSDLRSSIKYYLEQQGYTVLASEYNDFPKPLDKHSYEACFETLKLADYFILLIGSRVGGWYDEENSVSITQQEYREAYKLHQEGKIKLLVFVRSSIWDIKEDRKALSRLLETLDINDDLKNKIANHDSKFLKNSEFIIKFISEVCRIDDVKLNKQSGGARPTGNWVHSFSSFSDIAQVIQSQVSLNPPHEAVMRTLLKTDLSNILKQGLIKIDKKLVTPTNALNTAIEKLNFPSTVMDNVPLEVDSECWSTLQYLGVICYLVSFSPQVALEKTIETGLFLEYDIHKNEYRETSIHSSLCKLRDEINLFKTCKDNNSLKIVFTKYKKTGMRFLSFDFLQFISTLDRWANILELSICILNYLKYGIFNEVRSRPSSPIPSMQKQIEMEKIDDSQIEEILQKHRNR